MGIQRSKKTKVYDLEVSNSVDVSNDIVVEDLITIGGNIILSNSSGYIKLKSANNSVYTLTMGNDGSLVTEIVEFPIEYLVIAGGGGDGYDGNTVGAGGAGGYRSSVIGENSGGGSSAEPQPIIYTNTNYSVIVGAGGTRQSQGSYSTFSNISSTGGGRGGARYESGGTGGSGGGAGANNTTGKGSGISNQGFDGGVGASSNGGGGGGAGAAAIGKVGGDGVSSSITGTSVTRGGGGGGGSSLVGGGGAGGSGGGGSGRSGSGGGGSGPTSGAANTGGGSGGSAGTLSAVTNGGSGVVILKYPASLTATFSAGVTQSTSTNGGYKVSQITATSTTSETVTFA